jgi:hypothetical protein
MLRVTLGDRYSMTPFMDPKSQHSLHYPSQKLDVIKKLTAKADMGNVVNMFSSFVEPKIRNAFFHSNYVLHGDKFNITRGKGLLVDGVVTLSIPIDTEIVPRVNRSLEFFGAFTHVWRESIKAYTENKVITGRLGPDNSIVQIELMTEPDYGLTGFRSPPVA